MRPVAIVDTGPLLASLDQRDEDYDASAATLRRVDLQFVVSPLVVSEVAQLAGSRYGSWVEAAFLRGLHRFEIETPTADEWNLIADLVDRYADFPLGAVDASVVVLADRFETDLIVTLDRRHFGAVQSPRGRRFHLLPEQIAVHEDPATYEPTT